MRFVLAALALVCLRAAAEEPPQDRDYIGTLDEGKTYRRVGDYAITGKDVADVLVAAKWEDERIAYVQRVLVQDALAHAGLEVPPIEVEKELERLAAAYAQKKGLPAAAFTVEKLAREGRTSLKFLRDQTGTLLGFKKLLVREGRMKESDDADGPAATKAMGDRLEALIKERGVELDPTKLAEGEVLNVGGRGFSREQFRTFVVERLGPLPRAQLLDALELLTLEHLARQALLGLRKEPLSYDDRAIHFSYLCRLLEAENGSPDGRQSLLQILKRKGLTAEQYLEEREFTFGAILTCLARARITRKDIEAEYQAKPQAYQRPERKLAHIFVCVRDPHGRPYGPNWKAAGHPEVNAVAGEVRERQFAEARKKCEDLARQAQARPADFPALAEKYSEDPGTTARGLGKAQGGLIGRARAESVFPGLPLDGEVLQEAVKLKPGEVSGPLRSSYGWHVFLCWENQETTFEEPGTQERVYLVLLKAKRTEINKSLEEAARAQAKDKF